MARIYISLSIWLKKSKVNNVGRPTKVESIYMSAHDTNQSLTIYWFFSASGKKILQFYQVKYYLLAGIYIYLSIWQKWPKVNKVGQLIKVESIYVSAHDTNQSLTIEQFFSASGKRIYNLSGEILSFGKNITPTLFSFLIMFMFTIYSK